MSKIVSKRQIFIAIIFVGILGPSNSQSRSRPGILIFAKFLSACEAGTHAKDGPIDPNIKTSILNTYSNGLENDWTNQFIASKIYDLFPRDKPHDLLVKCLRQFVLQP